MTDIDEAANYLKDQYECGNTYSGYTIWDAIDEAVAICRAHLSAMSPVAKPVPEDVREQALKAVNAAYWKNLLSKNVVEDIVIALSEAGPLASSPPASGITVTREECADIVQHYEGMTGSSLTLAMAEALRHVLSARVRIEP
jgi:hypothetical protein